MSCEEGFSAYEGYEMDSPDHDHHDSDSLSVM